MVMVTQKRGMVKVARKLWLRWVKSCGLVATQKRGYEAVDSNLGCFVLNKTIGFEKKSLKAV